MTMLSREVCAALMLTFGHFLWQGTVIALITAVTARRIKSASRRYGMFVAALLLMSVSAAGTLAWLWPREGDAGQISNLRSQISEKSDLSNEMAAATLRDSQLNSDSRYGTNSRQRPNTGSLLDAPTDSSGGSDLKFEIRDLKLADAERESWNDSPTLSDSRWQRVAPCLTTAYLAGVGVMLLRLLVGLWGGWRLRRRAVAVDDVTLLAALKRQARTLGLTFEPLLAYCEQVAVPTVIGILKPTILLPLAITSGLSPEQIESVLAHELAHLRRYDHLVNLLQRVIESLLFFHPAVWWVSRHIRIEREHCCDDLVIICGAIPLDYATSLLRVAELSRRRTSSHSLAAVSLLATDGKPSTLRQRIARLLGDPIDTPVRIRSRWPVVVSGLAIVLTAIAMSQSSSKSDNKTKTEANPFLVTLPDGATVELLGVTTESVAEKNAAEGKAPRRPWWLPNGEPLKVEPLEELRPGSGIQLANLNYLPEYEDYARVVVRIRGLNGPDQNATWVVIDGARNSMAVSSGFESGGHDEIRTAGPLSGIKSGVVRVAVGVRKFGGWRTLRPNQPKVLETHGSIPDELKSSYQLASEITFREVDGQTRLVTAPLDVSKMRTLSESELVDVDGHVVNSSKFEAVNGEWGTTYPIPLARVSHYRFRLRPYRHWVTFENVSFQAGRRTEVKSSVGTTPDPRREPCGTELPGQIKVEFVGLARMEREPNEWWQPDGSPLAQPPVYEKSIFQYGDQEMRRVSLRVHGLRSVDDVKVTGMSYSTWDETHGSGGPFVLINGGMGMQRNQKTVKFEVGVASRSVTGFRRLDAQGKRVLKGVGVNSDSGIQGVIVVDPPKQQRIKPLIAVNLPEEFFSGVVAESPEDQQPLDAIEVEIAGPKPLLKPAIQNGQPVMTPEKEAENNERQKQTQIRWRAPSVHKPMDVEMVLIDTKQHRHSEVVSHETGLNEKTNPDGTPHWGSAWRAHNFNVPFDQVAGFEYRVRSYYHWVTFDNVSLHPGEMTDVKVTTQGFPAVQPGDSPRFTKPIQIDLTRSAAHSGRWFFVDLDRGRLLKPPFEIEADDSPGLSKLIPKRASEKDFVEWARKNGIDLVLHMEPKPSHDGSNRWNEHVKTRIIRSSVRSCGLLNPKLGDAPWTWKNQPELVVKEFARRSDVIDGGGFYTRSDTGSTYALDDANTHAFRTAENVIGFYMLEMRDIHKDELTLQIVHVTNVKTPLQDDSFEKTVVSGKNGAADPPAETKTQKVNHRLEPIRGEVFDAVTGEPIVGATVRFRFRKSLLDVDEKPVAELVFKNVGQFTFELPDAVQGQPDLFVERTAEHPDYQSIGPSGQHLSFVLKREPNPTRDFIRRVELAPGKVVTGRVLDLNGRPAKGVPIMAGPSRIGWQNGFAHKTTTDADGRYRLVVPENSVRGRIYVIPEHAAAVSRAISTNFGEQEDFQLLRGTRIHGRVVDAKGQGVAGVVLRADGSERVPLRFAVTDSDGQYSLPPCQYGTYLVELLDEGNKPGHAKRGVRLPGVYLSHVVELPKTALTEQLLNFQPTESVRVAARVTNSDDEPVELVHSLSLRGSVGTSSWWGVFRQMPKERGHYELRVPRGLSGLIDSNFANGRFLRIVRETTDGKTAPQGFAPFQADEVTFRIRLLKPSSITLRPTFNGKPISAKGHLTTPQFADQESARQLGATIPSTQFRYPNEHSLWLDVHPDIDITLKHEFLGFKPWQDTIRIPEGEDRVLDIQLEPSKPDEPKAAVESPPSKAVADLANAAATPPDLRLSGAEVSEAAIE